MLLHIPALLDAAQLASVTRLLARSDFVDGRLSAGKVAARVKRNRELDPGHAARDPLVNAVLSALLASPTFRHAAYPARLATPIFARYEAGMAYGDHVDDPLMGGREPRDQYRSDISYTLFLSAPDDYAGGDLLLHAALGEQRFRLPAGDLLLYPSTYLHRVEEVTAGCRLVMVGWLQSQVRDAARRQLLHDLWQARERLLDEAPEAPATRQVDTSYANLLRMWAET